MPSTLRELYLKSYPGVLRIALDVLANRAEAEDLAQEVFVEAWRRREQFDPSRGSEWSWLRAIARSRALDRLRACQRRRELEAEAPSPAPGARIEGESEDVRTLLSRLSNRERATLSLAYMDGLTHREISERTGEPLGTVKTRIRSALARRSQRARRRRPGRARAEAASPPAAARR
jgi:RNA polymerase sigma-70 factor (ECF subfamily)